MTLVTSRFVVFVEIIFLNKRRKRKKTEKNTQNTLAVLSSVFKFVPGDEQKDKSPRWLLTENLILLLNDIIVKLILA